MSITNITPISHNQISLLWCHLSIPIQIEFKKLRLHTAANGKSSKCQVLHVGKSCGECKALKVHDCEMNRAKFDTYLGDVVSVDGRNSRNVDARVSKAMGIIAHIMDILKQVVFGHHYFKVALVLRDAMLVNGVLTNAEVWLGLTQSDIKKLEEVDKIFMRQLFRVPKTCPVESFY